MVFSNHSKIYLYKESLKDNGSFIEFPHSFNIRIFITSCSWALLGSRFLIILPIFSREKSNDVKRDFVSVTKLVGSLLLLSRGMLCSSKYQWRSSHPNITYAFFWWYVGISPDIFPNQWRFQEEPIVFIAKDFIE